MAEKDIAEVLCEFGKKINLLCDKMEKKVQVVYTNAQMKEILGVGDKLLKKYRDEGYLSFSQVGDKYFYTLIDLEEFLRKSHRNAFR